MEKIIDVIARCVFEYEISTGVKPTRLYLGRQEMRELWKWAYNNGYQNNPGTAALKGNERPEVMGIPAYEVKDKGPHMRCCA